MKSPIDRLSARGVFAAITLVLPSVLFASSSPKALKNDEIPKTRPVVESAARHVSPAPMMKGALLGSVVEVLAANRGQEASPFEPPGKPGDRPPDNPGHNNPPNPPGQPPDRPPPDRPNH